MIRLFEPFAGRALRALLECAAALTLTLAGAPALADAVPGMAASPDRHLSYDPSPVTVRFQYRDGTRDLQIPRKYIVFASGGFSSLDGPIPDLIETTAIKIVFTYPDGEAWTVATRDYMREHGVSAHQAAVDMRQQMNIVQLRATNNFFNMDIVRQDYYVKTTEGKIGELGILEYMVGGGSQTLFLGSEEQEFLRVRCHNPRNHWWFCKYDARLTDKLVFSADLIDFRIFGGVDFANERIRMIKRKLCSFTETC